ncbi:phosphate ABC transporter substrate-binding protein [Clostridium algidicarnis]|uniref:phosphate ABC transporter substrate-binding protein n=1 Tax=Clostridium algidicarnis TaxID=37659 RepID=UPI001625E71F|nr:phosphate ABC transporter substrate-binding protein [Clostridium algidicarnis]MBB6631129.1 phosphate ABC transporter substrate-binding protein [Clostridium algidicarnis]MCB2285550.1 phosphate ABC transporter substrate-binding protein [Clostridium algidicarnis]
MNKNVSKFIKTGLSIVLIGGILAGCSTKSENKESENKQSENKIEGSITATGSTALQPLAQQIAKMFNEKNPNATINVQGGGSGTGLKDVSAGNADIGNSDVFAEEKLDADKAKELIDNKVCVVGFAAVANSKVTLNSLTKDQLIDIFTGKIVNWKELGGDDIKITIISRPDSSGTKATFKKYALDGAKEATGEALKEDSSGAVAKAVKETEGSISYLASSYLSNEKNLEGIKVLKYEDVEMSKENITTGKYPIWSYEHMYTKGEAAGVTKAYIEFFATDEAKSTMEKLGYYPTSDMKVTRDK